MLWLIQNILFSVSLIVVIHYLYIYFETTLTAPKVKDLIHCPKQKYKSLFDTINRNLDNTVSHQSKVGEGGGGGGDGQSSLSNTPDLGRGVQPTNNMNNDNEYNNQNVHHKGANNDMKTDLKAFLRGIGLKAKSKSDIPFRPSYETS
jgi:hypothetical protein